MTKFTPGPWTVCNVTDVFTEIGGENRAGIKADSNDGWQIADCNVGITFVGGEECELSLAEKRANAHLIAAAPELYAALKRLTEYGNVFRYRIGERNPYEQAVAALRKARGEPDA